MAHDEFFNGLVEGFVRRAQDNIMTLSEEDRAHFLRYYAMSSETADLCRAGRYTDELAEQLREIVEADGGTLPQLKPPLLMIPTEYPDGDPCFMLVGFILGRPVEVKILKEAPTWVNPCPPGSATYISEQLADVLALTSAGQSAAYVHLTETEALDVSGLADRFGDGHDFIVTRDNWDDEQNNNLRLRAPRRDLNAVLSSIGSEKYEDGANTLYADVWTLHKKDFNDGGHELADEIAQDLARVAELREEQEAPRYDPLDKVCRASTFGTVHDNEFTANIRELSNRQVIKSGIDRLDKTLGGGIVPGSLYVLGAAPSTGKTSLCVQLADEIVAQGYNVLFISLEQTDTELIAKSISRLSFEIAGHKPREALTSSDLLFRSYNFLDGANAGKLATYNAAIKAYHVPVQKYDYIDTGRLFIIRDRQDVDSMRKLAGTDPIKTEVPAGAPELADIYGTSDRLGVADLRDLIEAYSRLYADDEDERKRHPVLFVDYLQIMKPEQDGLSDKQNADLTISGLRRVVADFGVSLFAISSLNRSGYADQGKNNEYAAPTMANLKESGGIEYAADVVLMMYRKKTEEPEKLAKRTVCIKPLKNRNGPTNYTVRLNYYPAYNLFSTWDVEDPTAITEIGEGDPDEETRRRGPAS